MLFVQFIAILVFPVVAIWEHFRKPAAGRAHRFLIPILIGTAVVASLWLAYDANKRAAESQRQALESRKGTLQSNAATAKWQAEAKKWQGEATAQLSRMEGELGSEQMTQNYLEAAKSLSQQYANADTRAAADKFYSTREERQKLHEQVKLANSNLLLASKIRIQPIRDLVVAKLSQWQVELGRRNIKVLVGKHDPPVVLLSPATRAWETSILLTFESGETLNVLSVPSIVEDGMLSQSFILRIEYTSPAGADDFCQIVCSDKSYTITNQKPARFSFQQATGQLEHPIEDKAFVTAINDATDQIVGYMLDRYHQQRGG